MHVYHYAPYEPSVVKRLMGRYATREDEVDRLLRGGVFVDLYRVVRHGVRVSQDSLLDQEAGAALPARATAELKDAGSSIVAYERWLESGRAGERDDTIIEEHPPSTTRTTAGSNLGLRRLARGAARWRWRSARASTCPGRCRADGRRTAGIVGVGSACVRGPGGGAHRRRAGGSGRAIARRAGALAPGAAAPVAPAGGQGPSGGRTSTCAALSDEELADEADAIGGLSSLGPWVRPEARATGVPVPLRPSRSTGSRWATRPTTRGRESAGRVVGLDAGGRHDRPATPARVGRAAPNLARAAGADRHRAAARLRCCASASGCATTAWTTAGPNRRGDRSAAWAAAADRGSANGGRRSAIDGADLRWSGQGARTGRWTASTLADPGAAGFRQDVHRRADDPGARARRAHGRHHGARATRSSATCSTEVVRRGSEGRADRPRDAEGGTRRIDCNAQVVRCAATTRTCCGRWPGGKIDIAAGTSWMWSREEFAGTVDMLFVDEAGQMSLANVLAMAGGATTSCCSETRSSWTSR